MKKTISGAICALFLLCGVIAKADTLLVISSSGGMFGGDSATSAFEKFGLELVKQPLQSQYRMVYTWHTTDAVPLKLYARAIVNSQHAGEPLDVFAMEHGADSFMPGLSQQEVEAIFPKGMIRRLYSTGCSNWGTFSANADGTGLQANGGEFSEHLKRLGVKEYVIHANDNYTGPVSLPLLVSEFRKGGSWIAGARRAFERLDELAAKAFEPILGIDPVIQKLTGSSQIPLAFESIGDAVRDFLHSRPVFGGGDFPAYRDWFFGQNMFGANSSHSDEAMLAPEPDLVSVLKLELPGVYGDMSASTKTAVAPKTSLGDGVGAVAELLQNLLATYGGGDGDGCVDPKPFQVLVSAYLHTSDHYAPELRELCMQKTGDHEYTINWVLGPTYGAAMQEQMGEYVDEGEDIWQIPFPMAIDASGGPVQLTSMSFDRRGSLTISGVGTHASISVSGFGVNAHAKGLGIPDGLMHFYVRGADADASGGFRLHIGAPLFAIPVSAGGTLSGGSATIDPTINVAGIKIHVQM